RQHPQGGRNGKVLADDVIDLAVLLGEGDTEVATQQVAHVDEVLLGDGAVEAVTGLEVGADSLGHGALAGQRIARHAVHGDESGGGDEPDGDAALQEPLESVLPHYADIASYSVSVSIQALVKSLSGPKTRRRMPLSRGSVAYTPPRS